MDCVVCGSRTTCEIATFRPSISSGQKILDAAVENRLCEICGTVFNAGGARGRPDGCEDHSSDNSRTAKQVDVGLVVAPDPVNYLEDLRAAVGGDGRVRIGVPNFELKPDELLITDRVARLTPASLGRLYRRVGFEVLERTASPDRPWLWDLLRPVESGQPVSEETSEPDTEAVDRARRLGAQHVAFIRRAQLGFAEMLDELGDLGIAALFGRNALGILELHRCGGRGQAVRYILDDDPGLWGSRCHGREIHQPETLPRLGLSKVFLAANPCDHERLRSRLLALGMAASDIYP